MRRPQPHGALRRRAAGAGRAAALVLLLCGAGALHAAAPDTAPDTASGAAPDPGTPMAAAAATTTNEGAAAMALTISIHRSPAEAAMHMPIPVKALLRNDGETPALLPFNTGIHPMTWIFQPRDGGEAVVASERDRNVALHGRSPGMPPDEEVGPGVGYYYNAELSSMLTAPLPPGAYDLSVELRHRGAVLRSAPQPIRILPLPVAAGQRIPSAYGRRLLSIFATAEDPARIVLGDSPAGRPDLTALRPIAEAAGPVGSVAVAVEAEPSPLFRWAAWLEGGALHAGRAQQGGAVRRQVSVPMPAGPARLLPGAQFSDGHAVFPVVLGAPGAERMAMAHVFPEADPKLHEMSPPPVPLRLSALALRLGEEGAAAWAVGVAPGEAGGERLMARPLGLPDFLPLGDWSVATETDGAVVAMTTSGAGRTGSMVHAVLRTAAGGLRIAAVELATGAEAATAPLAATRAPVERIVAVEGPATELTAVGVIGAVAAIAGRDGAAAWSRLPLRLESGTRLQLVELAGGGLWLLTEDPQAGFGYALEPGRPGMSASDADEDDDADHGDPAAPAEEG